MRVVRRGEKVTGAGRSAHGSVIDQAKQVRTTPLHLPRWAKLVARHQQHATRKLLMDQRYTNWTLYHRNTTAARQVNRLNMLGSEPVMDPLA